MWINDENEKKRDREDRVHSVVDRSFSAPKALGMGNMGAAEGVGAGGQQQ